MRDLIFVPHRLETTADPPDVGAGSVTAAERDETIRAKSAAVLEHIEKGNPLVDVRSPDEFNGVIMAPPRLAETAQRKGHIPGGPSGAAWSACRLRIRPPRRVDPASAIENSSARRGADDDVLARLAQLFVERGPPTYLRSDNGREFTAAAVRDWLQRVGERRAEHYSEGLGDPEAPRLSVEAHAASTEGFKAQRSQAPR